MIFFNIVFLLIVFVSIILFSFLFSIFFLRYFVAEEDRVSWKTGFLPKIIFIISITLNLISIFLLPYSLISNKLIPKEDHGYYYLESVVLELLYFIIIVFVIVVIPFSICYYESEDPYSGKSVKRQCLSGSIFTVILSTLFLGIFLSTYFFLGYAEIEIMQLSVGELNDAKDNVKDALDSSVFDYCLSCSNIESSFQVKLSFIVYMIALISVVGYVLFVVFGGCGLTAYPVSLIVGFLKRARPISQPNYLKLKNEMRKKSSMLLEVGERIDKKLSLGTFDSNSDKRLYCDFKKESLKLANEWRIIKTGYEQGGAPVILSYCKLITGGFATIISLIWIYQVLFYLIFKVDSTGINYALNTIDYLIPGRIPIFSTILYGILIFHLILSVFYGSSEVMSTLPLVAVHPLIKGDTMMSSLLYNAEIFLLIGISINQFATYALYNFTGETTLSILFGTTVQNLKLFNIFYDYVVTYGFLIFVIIGFVYMLIRSLFPKKKTNDEKQLAKMIRRAKKYDYNMKSFKSIFKKRIKNIDDEKTNETINK